MLSAILGTFLLTMAAAGYFIVLSSGFGAVKSTGEAMQAQRYAEIEANKLSLLAYEELNTNIPQNTWKKIDVDNDWEYNIKLDPEKILNSSKNSKQRIATVSVRKVGDLTERFQIKTPIKSTSENSDTNIKTPNYDKKEMIAFYKGVKHYKNPQQFTLTTPNDGFLYVWIAGTEAGKNKKHGIVAINTNLTPIRYYNRYYEGSGTVGNKTDLFGTTGNSYNDRSGKNYIRAGIDVLFEIRSFYNIGYSSDLIPVKKGQNIAIMRPQGDLDTYVYLIPPQN